MSRHNALLPVGGRTGGVGLRSGTIRFRAEAPSSSKSPSSNPKGKRESRSRLVQVVRTERIFRSGVIGRIDKSTSERNISFPCSLGRAEGGRPPVQKQFSP